MSRLPRGGRIDRSRRISFRFAGKPYSGFAGDSLASALMANDVAIVGRSFKKRRPRGLMALGMEEANAVLNVGEGADVLPNRMATELALTEGLDARPTRGWPTVDFDIGRALDLWSWPFAAGFYYKTFMGPGLPGARDAWNKLWEPLIRRMAGQGDPPTEPDPDLYEHRNAHVDVAVVGAGLAGLAAARAAAASGAKVAIFERDGVPGGRALACPPGLTVEGREAADWAASAWRRLDERKNVTSVLNATAFGLYGDGFLAAYESPLTDSDRAGRIWHVRARRIVLAPGALERPMVFPGNDRPGVMLAGAVETAVRRYGVRPGTRAVIYANHAGAASAAAALNEAGVDLAAMVGPNETVVGTIGGGRLTGVEIAPLRDDGSPDKSAARRVAADLLATSGGWSPALALHLIQGGRQRWSANEGCFVADGGGLAAPALVGAANARFAGGAAVADGHRAGEAAAGRRTVTPPTTSGGDAGPVGQGLPIAPMAARKAKSKAFVDLQHDVTVADLEQAAAEGFRAIEHAKRYTTAGMATDQGRTAQLATAAVIAGATGRDIATVGLSGLRPPVTPVPFGALGGPFKHGLFHPVRKTPMHAQHDQLGAVYEDVGDWKRARYYPRRPNEPMGAAVARECQAVRQAAGALDVSTLGKIDVQGVDAGRFLNLVYTNRMDNLAVGACRYGLMLHDDGMAFDDGVVARLSERRFHLTTTSGGAGAVLDWLEDLRQTEWPDLQVRCASVTEQWAGVAIAGPGARAVVAEVLPALQMDGFRHMTWRDTTAFDGAARVFRVSFSGEVGFEVNVPWRKGPALWDALMAAGAAPYGTEAMHVLRAEKGFIVIGHETDGAVTPVDLGMSWIVSKKKDDFIGKFGLARPALEAPGRKQLVGLLPADPGVVLEEGAQLISTDRPTPPQRMLGHVTSSYWSETLGRGFALALLQDGRARHGERHFAWSQGAAHAVDVTGPVFYDLDGEKLRD